MIQVGIFGDTGMVGQEIERILGYHNLTEIVFRQNSKRKIGRLEECDLVFLATQDTESMKFVPGVIGMGVKAIDVSGAFRLPREKFEKWYGIKHQAPELLMESVYGMPALFKEQIVQARLVANPGCYPTSVILSLWPLQGLVQGEATVVATSGNSGARRNVETLSNEVTYAYGRKHKHVPEMELYSSFKVNFTPIVLRSVFKGINANIRIELADELKSLSDLVAAEKLREVVANAYRSEDLVEVVIDLENHQWGTWDVVDTHKVLVKINVDEGFAYICSLVDNLGKGAASGAVENMNLMQGKPRFYGINETYCST